MRKKQVLFVLLVILLTNCSSTPTVTEPPTETLAEIQTQLPSETPTSEPTKTPAPLPDNILELIAGDYPAVDGSTSTHPLQTTIACYILAVECEWWEDNFLNFDRRFQPTMGMIEQDADLANQIFTMFHNGTHGSYVSLIEGNADFILVARQSSADELNLANELGVTLDVRPVALDAFVFLVNEDNPLETLDTDTIRDIYTGEITYWNEVGITLDLGDDPTEPIHTYRRNPNSGSQELMEKLVMRGLEMIDSPDLTMMTMFAPFNAISVDPLGIGYSVYYYTEFMVLGEMVRIFGVDGVYPTFETIADGSYPLVTEVYVVIRKGMPPDSMAVYLRNWLLTEEGQGVVLDSGYVPIQ